MVALGETGTFTSFHDSFATNHSGACAPPLLNQGREPLPAALRFALRRTIHLSRGRRRWFWAFSSGGGAGSFGRVGGLDAGRNADAGEFQEPALGFIYRGGIRERLQNIGIEKHDVGAGAVSLMMLPANGTGEIVFRPHRIYHRPYKVPFSPPISRDRLGVQPKPGFQPLPAELVGFVKLYQELIGLKVIKIQPEAVNAQERGSDGDGRSLVAIHKRMILRKALKQCGRLLDNVLVIAALRPAQCRFQRAMVTDPMRPTKQNNQTRMSGEHIRKGRVKRHRASRRSSSGWAAMNSSIAA